MQDNPELSLAQQYIEKTNKNLFLTGKAGTGKTTFLKNLIKTTSKRCVVLAPTGVAALQASGVTLHSFFQLPFHIYIPGTKPKTKKFTKQKINFIRSLDLIIIDEISMVRCDILDEIDFILRRFRYNSQNKAFGGVQLLMIGDLSQLPPIVSNEEAQELSSYYKSFYFFGSLALQQSNYITITLQHIYRQQDDKFINILNAIRDNKINLNIIQELNTRYQPDIAKNVPDGYIVLCTHNSQADEINNRKINSLKTKDKVYTAEIEGDFSENIFPNSEKLLLKEGSQVMFLKNDYSQNANNVKKYYNGKIGVVKELENDYVVVQCEGDNEDIFVEKYTWENVRYKIDKETKAISEEIIGTFKQFPLKLAWAVTIHKSQGLTFDKVVINSNKAFSHGQVYVALSRCRTLEGLILTDKFNISSVILDNQITNFNLEQSQKVPTENSLLVAEQSFLIENIVFVFDFSQLSYNIGKLQKFISEVLIDIFPNKSNEITTKIKYYQTEIGEVSTKFIKWINNFIIDIHHFKESITQIIQRSLNAKTYFLEKIMCINDIIGDLLDIELDNSENNEDFQQILINIAVEKEIKFRLLNFFSKDFSSEAFLKLRNSILVEGISLELSSISNIKSEKQKVEISKKEKDKTKDEEDIKDKELFEILRLWRKEKAQEKKAPAYTIISQKGIISLANEKPLTKQEFLELKGLGNKTFENYGKDILSIIEKYCDK